MRAVADEVTGQLDVAVRAVSDVLDGRLVAERAHHTKALTAQVAVAVKALGEALAERLKEERAHHAGELAVLKDALHRQQALTAQAGTEAAAASRAADLTLQMAEHLKRQAGGPGEVRSAVEGLRDVLREVGSRQEELATLTQGVLDHLAAQQAVLRDLVERLARPPEVSVEPPAVTVDLSPLAGVLGELARAVAALGRPPETPAPRSPRVYKIDYGDGSPPATLTEGEAPARG